MRMQVEKITDQYKVRLFTEEDIPVIYEFCRENTTYYNYMRMQPTMENLKEVLTALPPQTKPEDKYFVGFYQEAELVALLDMCAGYPAKNTVYLGWFMVRKKLQKTGIGTELVQDLLSFLKKEGYYSVKLGCIKDNIEALEFWKKNGFGLTGICHDAGKYMVMDMERSIEMIVYRELSEEEIERGLFSHFIRHQVVENCWRRVDGQWCIQKVPFVDDWGEAEYKFLVKCLKNTVATGGVVYGVFVEGWLKGFASVETGLFGEKKEYLDLSSIHVSEDMRGQGIGKALFGKVKEWAAAHGAAKLYISAHSAVESQAFYRAMGCVEAQEYNKEHVEKEPYDCQLECALTN